MTMTAEASKETHGFQTEVKQLLHLMIHSLYSNREIFLRELVSNASDACDKLRFAALDQPDLMKNEPNLEVRVTINKEARQLVIEDSGIGMSYDEVKSNLGTIARSGTAEFLQSLTGDKQKDSRLIGQFGVGFYSSFIVADRVSVLTRKAGTDEGVLWESAGDGEFTIEKAAKAGRGTQITLHMKADADEFLEDFRLRSVLRKYSDHIAFPILMPKQDMPAAEDDEEKKEDADKQPEYEAVNSATALWTLSRSEIKDEEYTEFYKHVAHDFEDPLTWAHNRVEGKLEYTSLLYIPKRAPYDMWNREKPRGLKLYVQRVFIMDEADQFLPLYLRFVKGVVDSNDLSLNVSREILQNDAVVQKMRNALTKRVLDTLGKFAKDKPEEYAGFWKEFGQVLKEGPSEDFGNKEDIAKLFRFSSTHSDKAEQDVSLVDYVGRMREGQDKIYFVSGDSFANASKSPHLEVFRKKGIEVLLLTDRIDEWMVSGLREFDGKQFQDVARGSLDLGALDTEEEKKAREEAAEKNKDLAGRVAKALGDKVQEVRITDRLTESPACVVVNDQDMGIQMRKIMEAAGQKVDDFKPLFELNPEHPLVQRLDHEPDEDRFRELSLVLFDQALLAEAGSLDDAAAYVQRLNKLLLELSA